MWCFEDETRHVSRPGPWQVYAFGQFGFTLHTDIPHLQLTHINTDTHACVRQKGCEMHRLHELTVPAASELRADTPSFTGDVLRLS